jgi:hypothetical protein
MPYILKEDRSKFKEKINQVLDLIKKSNDNFYIKSEYFGYFVNRFVKKYLADPSYAQPSFNSRSFSDEKQKILSNAADTLGSWITKVDPIKGAGEINYVISAILWGFMGESKDFPQVGYGIRAFLEGILEKIKNSVEYIKNNSQRDTVMSFRKHIVIIGVLNHVMKESYRLKTSSYEDSKIQENGDVWLEGELLTGDSDE